MFVDLRNKWSLFASFTSRDNTDDQVTGYHSNEDILSVLKRKGCSVLETLSDRRGIVYGTVTGCLLGCQFLAVKSVDISSYQVMVYRSLVFLPCVFFISWDKSSSYEILDLICYILYGITNTLGILLAYVALHLAQIGNVTAITSNLPIPAALLAFCIFRETLTIFGLFFLAMNFVGLVLVSKPPFLFPQDIDEATAGQEGKNEFLGAVIALAALASLSLSTIFSRKLSYRDNVDAVLLSFIPGLTGVVVPGAVILFGQFWDHFHSVEEVIMCLLIGILSGVGNFFLVLALKYEVVSLITMLFTLSAPISFVLGILVLDEIPDLVSVVGAILILASTFGLQWRKWSTNQRLIACGERNWATKPSKIQYEENHGMYLSGQVKFHIWLALVCQDKGNRQIARFPVGL